MYVAQSILCASERNYFRIFGALQIKIIIIIIMFPGLSQEHQKENDTSQFHLSNFSASNCG